MRLLYGLMGVVAKMSGKMSRFRMNAIPSNWAVIGLCAIFAFVAADARNDAVNNGKTPQAITAGQFSNLPATPSQHRYVAVHGTIVPEASLTLEEDHSRSDLVPMIDRATRQGFYIKAREGQFSGKPQDVTVTGMTRSVSSDIRNDLLNKSANPDISFNTDTELNEGETPPDPLLSTLFMVACGLVGGVFLLSSLLQHTVFQRTRASSPVLSSSVLSNANMASSFSSSPVSSAAAASISSTGNAPISGSQWTPQNAANATANDIRMTGHLRLSEKIARRFLDVPIQRVRLENDALAFASNIDASSRMYGVVTQKRAGLWLMMPNPRTLTWQEGNLYNGFSPRPALKLRFNDVLNKDRKSTAILSFGSEAARTQAMQDLQKEVERARGVGAISI